MAKWEAEFSQMMNAQRDELEDYGANMQNAWESGIGNYDETFGPSTKFDGEGIPILGDYIFGEILFASQDIATSNVHLYP